MKITIISYYELKESLLSAAESLKQIGYEVDNYPLLQYYADVNDKKDDCLSHCISSLKQSQPNVILWWYTGVPVKFIEAVKNAFPQCFWIINSWDDPFSFTLPNYTAKLKFFDLAVSSCKGSLINYLKHKCLDAIHRPPGFDPKYHYPLSDIATNTSTEIYKYDVSFCCTNLYQSKDRYPNQIISRYDVVDLLANKLNVKFALFGPEDLKSEFPRVYCGSVSYYDTNKLFNESKINICTHVVGNQDGYFNERVALILGSGGLLLTDRVKGLDSVFKENEECLFFDSLDDLSETVKTTLENYVNFEKIKRAGHQRALQNHTWNVWADAIHIKICRKYFDQSYYQNKYNLQVKNPWLYWLRQGRSSKHIPFKHAHSPVSVTSTRLIKNNNDNINNRFMNTSDWYLMLASVTKLRRSYDALQDIHMITQRNPLLNMQQVMFALKKQSQ